jgi:hypothetical protein
MFPPLIATHSVVVGHEIPEKPVSTPDLFFQSLVPPVGLVEVTMLPPTATHNCSDGHEIPASCRPLVSTPVVTRHAPDGSVEVITSLEASIATQNVEDGHDTAFANGGGEGLGSGSAFPKLHASGDGVSANAGAATEADTTNLATTASASRHAPLRERGVRVRAPPRRDWLASVTAARGG